jgi:hypothetical protein
MSIEENIEKLQHKIKKLQHKAESVNRIKKFEEMMRNNENYQTLLDRRRKLIDQIKQLESDKKEVERSITFMEEDEFHCQFGMEDLKIKPSSEILSEPSWGYGLWFDPTEPGTKMQKKIPRGSFYIYFNGICYGEFHSYGCVLELKPSHLEYPPRYLIFEDFPVKPEGLNIEFGRPLRMEDFRIRLNENFKPSS